MRFHVIGIGPIGSLVAFHLRRSLPRHPVSLVVKTKARARDLRAGGGIAIEHGGVATAQGGYDIEVFDPIEEVVFDLVYNKKGEMRLPRGADDREWRRPGELGSAESMDIVQRPIEALIVCTKAQSTLGVLRRVRQRIDAHSTVVLLQNGMGVYERLVTELFRNPLERPQFVLATTTHAARAKTHGTTFHTIHTGLGELAYGVVPDPVGERDFERSAWDTGALALDDIAPPVQRGAARDRCASLRDTVAAFGALAELSPRWEPMAALQMRMKRKLVTNACINPMTAITQTSNGALFGNNAARHVARKVCAEAAAVFLREAEAEGAEPPRGLSARELQDEVHRVARRSAANYSSMLVDMWKGRQTEVEYLNGYLHRMGLKYGVPTPSNDLLYDLIKLKERVVPAVRM